LLSLAVMRPNEGFDTARSGTNTIGAEIGVSCEPRPASNVVRMPNISPAIVGRDTVINLYWP